MNWKKILKMPMPLNSRENRDKQFRQKIIDYEKDKIEPALTEYYSNNRAAENRPFKISFGAGKSGFYDFGSNGMEYTINPIDEGILGRNKLFILEVIKEIYEKEGYGVVLSGKDGSPGAEELTIEQ